MYVCMYVCMYVYICTCTLGLLSKADLKGDAMPVTWSSVALNVPRHRCQPAADVGLDCCEGRPFYPEIKTRLNPKP